MRLDGHKLCPHCGFRHGPFRPLFQSAFGWECPGCGRRLTTSYGRGLMAILVPCVVIYVVLGHCDTTLQKTIAIWGVWLLLGPPFFHLALDVRAAD